MSIAATSQQPIVTNVYLGNERPIQLIKYLDDPNTKSADIEIYTMNDKDALDAIRRAFARGVVIRIIKDPTPMQDTCPVFPDDVTVKTGGTTLQTLLNGKAAAEANMSPKDKANCADQRKLVAEINAKNKNGSAYIPFDKTQLCSDAAHCFEHGKLALFNANPAVNKDQLLHGATALISTGNFDITNFCNEHFDPKRCNRDYNKVENDPKVTVPLEAIFEHDFKGKSYDLKGLLDKMNPEGKVTVSPFARAPILDFLKHAKSSIYMEEQYLKDGQINEALQEAAARGVAIVISVADPCTFGPMNSSAAKKFDDTYSAFDNVCAGNSQSSCVPIKSHLFMANQTINGRPGYMHAKGIVVDKKFVWLGSTNCSENAFDNNREFGEFDDKSDLVLKTLLQMNADFNGGAPWQEFRRCAKKPSADVRSMVETAPEKGTNSVYDDHSDNGVDLPQ